MSVEYKYENSGDPDNEIGIYGTSDGCLYIEVTDEISVGNHEVPLTLSIALPAAEVENLAAALTSWLNEHGPGG